jgi:hypothetical protein
MDDIAKVFLSTVPILIPIIAIIGGITLAIVRTMGQQRLAELERRERIAAIERGVDPAKLPPPSSPYAYENGHGYAYGSRMRRAHGLFIGGLVVTAVGISLMLGLRVAEPHEGHWAIGTMPLLIGIALLVAAKVIWPPSEK